MYEIEVEKRCLGDKAHLHVGWASMNTESPCFVEGGGGECKMYMPGKGGEEEKEGDGWGWICARCGKAIPKQTRCGSTCIPCMRSFGALPVHESREDIIWPSDDKFVVEWRSTSRTNGAFALDGAWVERDEVVEKLEKGLFVDADEHLSLS